MGHTHMHPVKSSQIDAIGYDAERKVLTICFPAKGVQGIPGSVYEYQNVPQELFDQFLAAESKGSFFYANIRDEKEKYPYKKITAQD